MIDSIDIGYAIKDRRTQLGLTQEEVANAAGISHRCLWSLELGQNPGVQFNKLTAVLQALGLDLRIEPKKAPAPSDIIHSSKMRLSDAGAPLEEASSLPRKSEGDIDALAILTGERK